MLAPTEWTTELITAEVRLAARTLASESGVTRVWFFGSAAARRPLDYASDLDLAVEGLPGERYFGTLGALLSILRCPLDLVRWENASDALRAQILSTGTLVYAA
ncbi:MAG: uncharacterized protein QOE70_3506 [Chthoniobacter sp.]|jgi:predicted nucleotidyltransferase|nr:uncharacterized protein [Chthoniobacter sp.]